MWVKCHECDHIIIMNDSTDMQRVYVYCNDHMINGERTREVWK